MLNNIHKVVLSVSIILIISTELPSQYKFKRFAIWSETRKTLTIEYQKKHYGLDTYLLKNPRMIVIHYTGLNSLSQSLNYFKQPILSSKRKEIIHGGRLNVGVHFVVAKNGTIYSLLPEYVAGRHAIGFNYTSFGIENIGSSTAQLTRQQVAANAYLVKYLIVKYPTIKHLIGHNEYAITSYPHFSLHKALDKTYKFTQKKDPGERFMRKLRKRLKIKYNIKLQK